MITIGRFNLGSSNDLFSSNLDREEKMNMNHLEKKYAHTSVFFLDTFILLVVS
jgi:hypothetical protein